MVLSFLLAIENDYLKYVRSMRLHIQEWKWAFSILMLYIEVTEIIKKTQLMCTWLPAKSNERSRAKENK